MRLSIRKGFGFGLTSGIITTLGLMVGLNSSTHSALVVIGGIIVIAVADALSDSLGIHISEESENKHTQREIWESTLATFLSKLVFALTFIIPVLLLPLSLAIIVSVIWGLSLLGVFSYFIARMGGIKPYRVVTEHLAIAVLVIVVTHYIGEFVGTFI
jgi:VIT1/CCC1 family predicted Fe2+/Mn2+ transporter